MAKGYADFTFRADCGHEIKIPLAGRNLDADVDYTCSVCGHLGVLEEEQVAGIKKAIEVAKAQFIDDARKQLADGMLSMAARHKGVTYRPK